MSDTITPPTATKFHVSYGPHIRNDLSTSQIMWMVNGALVPALIWSILVFGLNPLGVTISAILGTVFGEEMVCRLRKRTSTLKDGSAVCSGLLLAFTLPTGLPIWIPFIGGFIAIVLTKGLFGGLGYNIFNVALIGRALLMASFPVDMTTQWLVPQWGNIIHHDAVTMATPLAIMKEKGFDAVIQMMRASPSDLNFYLKLILGLRTGSIGEVSSLMILMGALFLIWKKLIKLYIPLSIFAGVFLISLISQSSFIFMFGGGLWLGAFFMATDYVTSPTTPKGQIVFGLGIGILTALIRLYGGYPEGICYAILLMNIITPALNDWFRPKRIFVEGAPS